MQRLFSIFPQGTPGLGLALLRLAVTAGLVLHDPASLWPEHGDALRLAMGIVAGGLLLGALTPWFGSLCGLLAAQVAWRTGVAPAAILPSLLFGLSALALVLLGPGAYSLDARLFGRRRLKLGARRR